MHKYLVDFAVENLFGALMVRSDYPPALVVAGVNVTTMWGRDSTHFMRCLPGITMQRLWDLQLQRYPRVSDLVIAALNPEQLAWVAVHKRDTDLLARASIPNISTLQDLALCAPTWTMLSTLADHKLWRILSLQTLILKPPSIRNKPKMMAKMIFHWDMLPQCVYFENIQVLPQLHQGKIHLLLTSSQKQRLTTDYY